MRRRESMDLTDSTTVEGLCWVEVFGLRKPAPRVAAQCFVMPGAAEPLVLPE